MSTHDLPAFDPVDYGVHLIEEERRRIARDLHDGPAQDLTNISMRLNIVERLVQSDTEMALTELTRTNQRIVSAVNEIRRLIYDLRPVAIDEVGLVAAVVELCRRCERDWHLTIEVAAQPEASNTIVPARQIALYRLIQEVLQNVHKHAQAQRVEVRIMQQNDQLSIDIEDDGRGFDSDHIPQGHFGIEGIKERTLFLGGALNIRSAPGHGTTVSVRLPCHQKGLTAT